AASGSPEKCVNMSSPERYVKQLVARKFDLSCGFAMSIDTEKIKVRFSQIYTDDFLFRHGIPRTFVVKVYPSWRN
ncbi:hypothetical protein, partial [Escherichia coli]|uniref:hypothetical protein n=1 Tax=Escherichia coli TaxID=562 RepID=UPI0023621BF2